MPKLIQLLKDSLVVNKQKREALDPKIKSIAEAISKTLKEKKISLKKFFKNLDTSGDGFVDKSEFTNGVRSMIKDFATEELYNLFDALDKDK